MRESCSKTEIAAVAAGFVLSMVHWTLCFAYFAALLLYIKQGIIGSIKALLILTVRSVLSTGVAGAFTGVVSYERLALIFAFSIYILSESNFCEKPQSVKTTSKLVILFAVYNVIVGFVTSSYPIVSAFKSINYAVSFCAVLAGVSYTNDQIDWMGYLEGLLTPILVLSIVLLFIPSRSHIVNSDFQGAINHPNMFGIVASIYIGVALYNVGQHPEKGNWIKIILIGVSYYMIFLCKSRTGMFSAIIMLVIDIVTLKGKVKGKIIGIITAVIVLSIVLSVIYGSGINRLADEVQQFIYKRNVDNIWNSRQMLFDVSDQKYRAHPLIGSGFSVPYRANGGQSFGFSLSLTYETGNIWKAVLGDCGIIGTVIFWGYMLYIFVHTNRSKWVLYFYPIVLSMGEMAFFATNSIAIIYYLFFGLCLAPVTSGSRIQVALRPKIQFEEERL